ncbi:MAG: phosphoenolpyruvate--protein phosphotransferase [Spirochaetales bacterium]|nr:phosphoenolpyruvate--protein phosphotransferase [Spirochaetales bacterium]
MRFLEGKSASAGICRGTAYLFSVPELKFEPGVIEDTDIEGQRLEKAFSDTFNELSLIKSGLSESLGEEYGHIFRAQMTMAEDEEFLKDTVDIILEEKCCAEQALTAIYDGYSELFASLGEDDYNRQRLADLTDVFKRILRNLLGIQEVSLAGVPKGSIVMAEDLLPSDTAMMNRNNVLGIISEKGGVTSHVAILAKSLGIPAAVGVANAMSEADQAMEVLLDTSDFEKASVCLNPDNEKRASFLTKMEDYNRRKREILLNKDLEPVTLDGKKVELSINIGSIEELESGLEFGAKSIGLLRTEFFFLGSQSLPDEEKQFRFYRTAAEKMAPGMVVIRTLDIGGDKEVSCFSLPKEDNPFLGLRGIRVSLKYRDMFKTQLRAIMRAAAYGNVKVMFPMVADVSEFLLAKEIIAEAVGELKAEGEVYDSDLEAGVMVETPAAVLLTDLLTRKADFVSIGTNDLTQYVLCADRINENVSSYYRLFSPAVFRALKMTAENAHQNGRWAGICGELGGMSLAIPVLVGLGIDELSMNARQLPEAVSIIRKLNYEECRLAADKVLSMETEEEIKDYLQSKF